MRRIYFLVPNIKLTHKIVEELQAKGIEDRHIHILAKRDTPLEGMPEAGVSIKTDFLPAVERGVALGGINGIIGRLNWFALCGVCDCGRAAFGDHYRRCNHRVSDGRFNGNECRQFKAKTV